MPSRSTPSASSRTRRIPRGAILVDFLTSEDGQRVLQKATTAAMPSAGDETGLRPRTAASATFQAGRNHDRIPGVGSSASCFGTPWALQR